MKGINDMSITIEKNIPTPPKRNIYPYRQMDVGDSFLVPEARIQIVSNNNYRVSKLTGMRFIARREGMGVRVWRTE